MWHVCARARIVLVVALFVLFVLFILCAGWQRPSAHAHMHAHTYARLRVFCSCYYDYMGIRAPGMYVHTYTEL